MTTIDLGELVLLALELAILVQGKMYPPLRCRMEDNRIELYQTRSESYAAFGEAKIWWGERLGGAKISARPGRSNLHRPHRAGFEPLRGRGCSQIVREFKRQAPQSLRLMPPLQPGSNPARSRQGSLLRPERAEIFAPPDLRPTVRFKRMNSRRESQERFGVLFALSLFARRSRSREKLVTDPETDPGAFAIRLKQDGHP